MTSESTYRLSAFGAIQLTDEHGRKLASVLSQPKRLALLLYLASARNSQLRRRDTVVSLFWPELDDEHARGALRQALTYLRRALGDDVIITMGDEIGVDSERLRFDVHEFDEACAAGRLSEAVALYQGDFLEAFFVSDVSPELERRFDDERERLRRAACEACWMLAREALVQEDKEAAASWGRRAAAIAPQEEGELRKLIMLLDDVGDRAAAVKAYQQFSDDLKTEYGVAPSAETQLLIEQIRTRLVALPDQPITAYEHTDARATAAPHQPPRIQRSRKRAITFATAIGVLALGGYLIAFFAGSRSVGERVIRVAVLPIADVMRDSAASYLMAGLTDELTTDLAQVRGLEVISARTMAKYRGSSDDLDKISRDLGADVVLATSFQRFDTMVHMTARLVRPARKSVVWARSFEGRPENLLRIQERIASAVHTDLLRQTRAQGLGPHEPVAPAALDLYARGRHWWNRRGREALLRSIDYFEQALDIEPTFALAYSGMGDAYVQLGYGSLLRPDDAFPKARAAALRALQLDSMLAEPHATLAFVAMYFEWNWATAEREFKQALARNPNYATAHEWYGLFLAAMGRFDEAVAHERRAEELDPLSVAVAGTAGWVLHYSGHNEDALRVLRVALREDSNFALGHLYLGRVHQAEGRLDSALAQFEKTGPLRKWVPTIAGIANVYGSQGRRADALRILSTMDSLSRSEYVTAYAYALIHSALGQRDSAFVWLDRGVDERTHWLLWLNRDFRWQPLKTDPRFAALTQRLRLPP